MTGQPKVETLMPEHKDEQTSKLLEVFKALHINIPFIQVLKQMPMYDELMKELLSEERPLKGDQTVVLTKECSAIIQRNLPSKMPDPESFQIPCTIGNNTFERALCDLGASINLMLLFVIKKLQIQEVKLTRIALQLADKFVRLVYGVGENVLVKVEKFFFPIDFVILDMEEDENFSIILGRLFLATG
ncbi:uncharacterized protein LOC107611570 [Arachis ipaensis]|uniref:uncharacterized protein LOC107611570 n=1 Tax=Arachis ipaensis TaxID=130454 RepID=UPI0007AEF999|nr:uncharacterized protein LOC107611570 [Arachis ipaensis]